MNTNSIARLAFLVCAVLFPSAHICKSNSGRTITQKRIVVIIPSLNNVDVVEFCLSSIFSQKSHNNYQIIYIDDCSTDGTGQKALEVAQQYHQQERFTLISNTERAGALANLWSTIHTCDDQDICLLVDGDDALADNLVFYRINKIYSTTDTWLTYGQFIEYPSGAKGWCQPFPAETVKNHKFRSHPALPSHLRTFYAWLFKRVKLQDLLYNNTFYPMSWDAAMMLPMIEMAADHFQFVDDVVYLYRSQTLLNDHALGHQLQCYLCRVIRSKKPYPKLEKTVLSKEKTIKPCVDMLIFSSDNPLQLYALLQSVTQRIKGLLVVHVIYKATTQECAAAYHEIRNTFKDYEYIQLFDDLPDDFKAVTLFNILRIRSPYVLLARDYNLITDTVDLNACIGALEKTHAYAFYLSLGSNITHRHPFPYAYKQPPLIEVSSSIYAWQFKAGEGDWARPRTFDLSLYHRADLQRQMLNLNFDNLYTLDTMWGLTADLDAVGLCFQHSKAVTLIPPSQTVQDQAILPALWKIGKRIEIGPFDKFAPVSSALPLHLESLAQI